MCIYFICTFFLLAPACIQDLKTKQSEDCLYLNIFVPSNPNSPGTLPDKEKLPVMVFFHGGSFQRGSSLNIPGQSYEQLNKNGIIYISVNYRLGIFGFFSHPALSLEDPTRKTNFGLYDQREALKWIQRNIESFGGDPNRVTISGNV